MEKTQRPLKKTASTYDFLQIRVQYPKPEPDESYLVTISYRRLTPTDAIAYRLLMLEAYTLHPDAFTSDVKEREALPFA
ncbi:hypothetical protein ALO95_04920 [Pseudomonas syringae pv. antirrhini]|uniref:Acetyltransferase, GNAT family n=2 Tax=Pseudomonas syringae group genomosp. 3 TaxID=251701 RepID=A0A3M6BKZ1_PSEYM|nr:hypothetical protein ALQ85_04465 [Pseudomonas syringae]RMP39540.1 hypothetical protein ALQ24_05727 [Pseudomonas syringae pv. antirrhini]RMV32229.1 hypothetical protein ALP13_04771 [Pseudomonas syringae pv. maculicola]RMW23133.1 hypothetical protein ALO95_04920 [Pseudomonas syringae pv. antirrhini]